MWHGGCALTVSTARETHLRKVPIRRVQEASRQDERVEGSQGWREEQLDEDDLGQQQARPVYTSLAANRHSSNRNRRLENIGPYFE